MCMLCVAYVYVCVYVHVCVSVHIKFMRSVKTLVYKYGGGI